MSFLGALSISATLSTESEPTHTKNEQSGQDDCLSENSCTVLPLSSLKQELLLWAHGAITLPCHVQTCLGRGEKGPLLGLIEFGQNTDLLVW